MGGSVQLTHFHITSFHISSSRWLSGHTFHHTFSPPSVINPHNSEGYRGSISLLDTGIALTGNGSMNTVAGGPGSGGGGVSFGGSITSMRTLARPADIPKSFSRRIGQVNGPFVPLRHPVVDAQYHHRIVGLVGDHYPGAQWKALMGSGHLVLGKDLATGGLPANELVVVVTGRSLFHIRRLGIRQRAEATPAGAGSFL